MDFMKMLRSLEELLYEVMTWLVFYPRTFILTLFRPLRTLEYCRAQFHRPEEDQFDTSLSPPLFLLLSLLISHAVELAFRFDPLGDGRLGSVQLSPQNLIAFRALIYAGFPLMYALHHVKQSDLPLSRKTLRAPFFIQCFPAAVFALLLQLGFTIAGAAPAWRVPAYLLSGGATIWYLCVQTAWIRRSEVNLGRAFGTAVWQFIKAAAIVFVVAVFIAFGLKQGTATAGPPFGF